jgi:hypothetical protein
MGHVSPDQAKRNPGFLGVRWLQSRLAIRSMA